MQFRCEFASTGAGGCLLHGRRMVWDELSVIALDICVDGWKHGGLEPKTEYICGV